MSVAVAATAQVTTLFQSSSDLAGTTSLVFDPPNTFAASVDGSAIFGSGDALRVADFSGDAKPEVTWAPANVNRITTAFRLDLKGYTDAIDVANDKDIQLRFSDSDDGITSNARVMSTISFEASGKLKVNGSTYYTFTSGVAADVSIVLNVAVDDPEISGDENLLNYTLFNESYSFASQTIDLFVNGDLVGTKAMSVGANFDPIDGVYKIGFIGSSNSDINMDYHFDDFILYEGSDISVPLAGPEPSSFALIFGAAALEFSTCRRRRKA